MELKAPDRSAQQTATSGADDFAARKQRRSAIQKMTRELSALETTIEHTEAKIEAVDAAMCEPDADYVALGIERADASNSLDAAMAEWEALSVKLEAAQAAAGNDL